MACAAPPAEYGSSGPAVARVFVKNAQVMPCHPFQTTYPMTSTSGMSSRSAPAVTTTLITRARAASLPSTWRTTTQYIGRKSRNHAVKKPIAPVIGARRKNTRYSTANDESRHPISVAISSGCILRGRKGCSSWACSAVGPRPEKRGSWM